jgi:carbamoyltransferase
VSAVLGISAYHADAAAALMVDGRLAAAVAEERYTRIKHWAGFPANAVRACLAMAGLTPGAVDRFAVGRDPRAHLARKALFTLRARPSFLALRDRAVNANRVRDVATPLGAALDLDPAHVRARLSFVEHHPAHLASAFFVSPFESAAVCAVDGFGDFVSTSWASGRDRTLDVIQRVLFPHSLGLFYLAVTQHLGFLGYGDEYKVMGLAAHGRPDAARLLRQLVALKPDGGFVLDLGFFRHAGYGVSMTWDGGEPTIGPVYSERLMALLGPARRPEDPIESRHADIAASVQAVFEEAMFHVLGALQRRTGERRLCLAGGCALNSVANGKIRERTGFEEVFVQPAAGDDGTALGAALSVCHRERGEPRRFVMEHAYWGAQWTDEEARRELENFREALARRQCAVAEMDDDEALCAWTADRLASGKVVGWFQGRMEWGARALGNRSILADPRRADMREIINARIKRREPFRPFAPAVAEEALDDYFAGAVADPFMAQVYPVRPNKRALIPAVTHVDGSGRVQTVSRRHNLRFWLLLRAFEKRAGIPVLLNTSFNESEPIVLRPAEAIDCFLRTDMDALALGRSVIEKA